MIHSLKVFLSLSGAVRHGEYPGTSTSDKLSEAIKAPPSTSPLSSQRCRIKVPLGCGLFACAFRLWPAQNHQPKQVQQVGCEGKVTP